jgi:hypothetical protein
MTTSPHGRLTLARTLALLACVVVAPARHAPAQPVDARRVEQLKANIQAEQLRVDAQDFAGSSRIRAELDELRDDVGFVLVVLRRGQPVADEECHALETRLQRIRQELHRTDAWPSGDPGPDADTPFVVPGEELDVALTRPISSGVATIEDRLEGVTVADLSQQGQVVIPAGSRLSGLVTRASRAWHPDARGSLTVVFDQITVHGRTYAVDTAVTAAVEADIKGEIANLVLDARHAVVAAEGREVELSVGSVLRVRFLSPLELSSR